MGVAISSHLFVEGAKNQDIIALGPDTQVLLLKTKASSGGVLPFLDNFHYQITGDSSHPKLVFLHGVMGFAANWRRITKAFEDNYQTLAFDQRGHGRSFQPTLGYGPDDYAGDLLKILDELQWQKVTLIGHSMGGRVAFHFASEHPVRVERLVIEDIGPVMNPYGASLVTSLINHIPVPFPSKRAAKEFFDTKFMEIYKDHPQRLGLAAYLYANLTENENKEAVWRFYLPGIRESISQGAAIERWEEIEALQMPTLVARGEMSRDLPHETFLKILRRNPRIDGVEIPGAGHWVHSDQPELFIQALRAFFEKYPVQTKK